MIQPERSLRSLPLWCLINLAVGPRDTGVGYDDRGEPALAASKAEEFWIQVCRNIVANQVRCATLASVGLLIFG